MRSEEGGSKPCSFLDWVTSVGSSRSFLLFKKWRHSISTVEEGGEERRLLVLVRTNKKILLTALNQSSTCRTYPNLEKVLLFLLSIVFFFFFSRGLNIASNLFSCLFGQHSEYHHQRHGNKKQLSVYNVINNSGNCATSSEYLQITQFWIVLRTTISFFSNLW